MNFSRYYSGAFDPNIIINIVWTAFFMDGDFVLMAFLRGWHFLCGRGFVLTLILCRQLF